MGDASVNEIRPGFVPPEYSYRHTIEGPAATGFGRIQDQVALFYARGWSNDEMALPLVIHIGPAGAPALWATEGHSGTPIDIGFGETAAVYHDGLWSVGPGEDQSPSPGVLLHWEKSSIHSVTARSSHGTYAVRGAKTMGVDTEDLIRVARSLLAPEH